MEFKIQKQLKNLLPKMPFPLLNGGVYPQRVSCGRQNCRCSDGHLHSAYYLITRINGRQRKIYVPRKKVSEVEDLVLALKLKRSGIRNAIQSSREVLKQYRYQIRELRFSPAICGESREAA
jgi:hypothetical protein